jgi:exonuclease III
VCIQEAKIANLSQRVVLSALGSDFSDYVVLPAVGASRGVLVACKQHLQAIGNKRVLILTASLFNFAQMWIWIGGWPVYMDPKAMMKKIAFLKELRDVRSVCLGPWMVAGDFNLIYKAEDKSNTNYNRAMMGRYRRFINAFALKDIPLHDRQFTWSNQHESPTLVKLDRVFCTV